METLLNMAEKQLPDLPKLPELSESHLDKLLILHQKYIDDEKYVYKLVSISLLKHNKYEYYLITMRKLDDTKTNEKRNNVDDSKYAKFRANKLFVESIVNIFNIEDTLTKIVNWIMLTPTLGKYGARTLEYIVGEIVYPDHFDNGLNVICTQGIHYFKTIEAAYYYGREHNVHSYIQLDNCKYTKWTDSGVKIYSQKRNYDGQIIRQYWRRCSKITTTLVSNDAQYYLSSEGEIIYNQTRDIKIGIWRTYYKNGIATSTQQHDGNNNIIGKELFWDSNGKLLKCINSHHNGFERKHYPVLSESWHNGVTKQSRASHFNGKLCGLEQTWYLNGQKGVEAIYCNGLQIGICKINNILTICDINGNVVHKKFT